MTNKRSTKSALIASVISLLLCFTMLLGTTYAWFTDSVTSEGNIIKTGNLDVEMYHAPATEDPAKANWTDASQGPIFMYENWEPGYVEAHHIKISNVGSLALKYEILIELEEKGIKEDITDVIDVYYADAAQQVATRGDLSNLEYLGTLTAVLDGLDTYGELEAGTSDVITLALAMKTSAGNEYMNKQVGPFTVKLLATQKMSESDSFDNKYDEGAFLSTIENAAQLASALEIGGSYKLGADIALDETVTVPAGVKTVLNLNGKNITNSNGYAIKNLGDLIINGNGTINGLGGVNSEGGTLTINGGTYTGSSNYKNSQWEHAIRVTNSKCVINGGIFDASIGGMNNAMINVSDNGNVVINGGVFKSNVYEDVQTYMFTYKDGGSLTINDGDFSGSWRFNSNASTDIYGGNFNITTDGQSFNSGNTHELTVYGGTFKFGKTATETAVLGCVADGYSAVNNGDGMYTVLKGDVVATDNATLSKAISEGETNIALAPGAYTMPQDYTLQGKTLTVTGTKDAVVDISAIPTNGSQAFSGTTLVFEGVTLNCAKVNYFGFTHAKSLTYKNCQINGLQFLFAEKVVFENCDLNSDGAEHCVWTWSGDRNISFTDCDFTYTDRAVNCYGENGTTDISFTNCTFTKVEGNDTTGAIETNSSALTALNLTINNCSVNEGALWFVSGWDSLGGANTTVTVDGQASKGVVLVQSSVLPYLNLNSNSTYMLTGNFGGQNVALIMAKGVENIVFDGSNATNINELIITQNGQLIDNANDVVGERSGNVTV